MYVAALKRIAFPFIMFYKKVSKSIFSQMIVNDIKVPASHVFLSCILKACYLIFNNLCKSFRVYSCCAVKAESL